MNLWFMVIFLGILLVRLNNDVSCQSLRGPLIWQEEFDEFNLTLWKHWVTTVQHSTPSEFQYFTNSRNNRSELYKSL